MFGPMVQRILMSKAPLHSKEPVECWKDQNKADRGSRDRKYSDNMVLAIAEIDDASQLITPEPTCV